MYYNSVNHHYIKVPLCNAIDWVYHVSMLYNFCHNVHENVPIKPALRLSIPHYTTDYASKMMTHLQLVT